jgi:L-seryl-tRNA(Ser) seleniumtransferase
MHQSTVPRGVINAWGTATPFGVSRSPGAVADAVAAMLQRHVVMADLQADAGLLLVQWSGAPAACVTHCTAAAVTLAIAACMAGCEAARIAQLPDASGMPRRVLMLASHDVNYGHRISQAVRLAGAKPVKCDSVAVVAAELAAGGVACVLAVESHLAAGSGSAVTRELLSLAHGAGVPLVLDAAAQDWRVVDLVASGADLVLISAQKYLAAPTAGLVLGAAALVAAVDAQHGGIGRGMKPSKEAIAGVMAAVQSRQQESSGVWRDSQARKLEALLAAARHWPVTARIEPDPQGNGFSRLWLEVDGGRAGRDAEAVARALREGDPVVAVAPHRLARGQIGLELTGVDDSELPALCAALAAALRA